MNILAELKSLCVIKKVEEKKFKLAMHKECNSAILCSNNSNEMISIIT